jgi:hypothetical protein
MVLPHSFATARGCGILEASDTLSNGIVQLSSSRRLRAVPDCCVRAGSGFLWPLCAVLLV